MKKRNCEEIQDGFPTNGIKYESKDVNYRHDNVTNKELQKEVKRLQGLLEKVRWSEQHLVFSLANLPNWSHVFILQAQMEKDKVGSRMSQLVSKPSCMV